MMKKIFLTLLAGGIISSVCAQIHETGTSVGIGTTAPVEGLTVASVSPNALGMYRDLDVGVVGAAAVFLNFGARSGSVFSTGAQIAGVLGNPASTGWMSFSTLNLGTLSEKMRLTKEGNMGLGTNEPENVDGWGRVFEVKGAVDSKILVSSNQINTGMWSHDYGYHGAPAGGITGTATNHPFSIMTNKTTKMVVTTSGDVGIGTTDPKGYKLAVNGKIRSQEIKVEAVNWPDYVFAKSYQLPTLLETEKHIKEKGHLPGIPSATEVKSNGIDLGEMNAKLLQKIEELTLHLIEQSKMNCQSLERLRDQELKDMKQEQRIKMLEEQLKKIKN